MRCPFCGSREDKVLDSREATEGDTIKRRRECKICGRRFTILNFACGDIHDRLGELVSVVGTLLALWCLFGHAC